MPIRCQLLSAPCWMLTGASQAASRQFSTSSSLLKAGGDLGSHLPKNVIPRGAILPEYPYGPSLLYKQSNKGLYGGAMIQFGNNVSPDTETKTRRSWHPNVLSKSLYSIALKKKIKLRVTANVLKTIDREGGLDEYLLGDKESRIKELGPVGWQLRWAIMQTGIVRNRMIAQARELGLPEDVIRERWGTPRKLQPEGVKASTLREQRKEHRAKLTKMAKKYRKEGLVADIPEGIKMAMKNLKLEAEMSNDVVEETVEATMEEVTEVPVEDSTETVVAEAAEEAVEPKKVQREAPEGKAS